MTPILTITGSDNTGISGIQADIKTIVTLGGYALTAITAVTIQNKRGMIDIIDIPQNIVIGQVKAIIDDFHPKSIKIGMLRGTSTIQAVRDEVIACPQIILVPGILNVQGQQLMDRDDIEAWKQILIPEATILQLRCNEAELLLGRKIISDDDMQEAASEICDMGAKAVLLRGGHQTEGRLTALLYHKNKYRFFSSTNTEGWQKHGIGGTLSAAIATRLAFGDTLDTAINKAHEYMHNQVVYTVKTKENEKSGQRTADIYNSFMNLIAQHYRQAHDVSFYANHLCVTTRYLSRVTNNAVGISPKELIDNYLMHEAKMLMLSTTLSISEIADRLGFPNDARFSNYFKNLQGSSPGQWRQEYKQSV